MRSVSAPPAEPEDDEETALAKMREQQEADAKEFAKLLKWFDRKCQRYLPLWEMRVADELAKRRADNPDPSVVPDAQLRADIALSLAESAERDEGLKNDEIGSMLSRTNILVAAISLLLGVVALVLAIRATAQHGISMAFLVIVLFFTGVGLVASLKPICPPIKRAWKEPFVDAHFWELLRTGPYERWVMACYMINRRNPVITKYKRAHSIAGPAMMIALVGVVLVAPLI